MAIAPEALLAQWVGADSAVAQAAHQLGPFMVPYDHLADDDGWILWLGHPPVPDDLPLLPVPDNLLWGEPVAALATATLVSADYAVRRGAVDAATATIITKREGPIVIVVPGPLHPTLSDELDRVRNVGIPVIVDGAASWTTIAAQVPTLLARANAHAALQSRRHDPALSFQSFAAIEAIGGDSLSSFVLHADGDRDNLSLVGEFGRRVAIEIGLRGPGVTMASSADLETIATGIPSFLDGVTSSPAGGSLRIGWRPGRQPSAQELGNVFRIWLRALTDAALVDVRIAFAPERGRSALLADMRARANTYRRHRQSIIDTGTPATGVGIESKRDSAFDQ